MNHQLNSAGVNNQLFQYVPQAGTVSYGTADVDNALTTETANSGSASFTYDGNHNLTYDGYNTLSYDVENRLIAAENAAWGTSTYLYDPLDERKQKVVGADTAMPVATDFVLAGGEEIADYYETSATWRLTVRGAGGLPLAAVVPAAGGGSEEIVYVHHDRKGSTVALTVPGGGGPAETYTYSDYGQPQSGTWLAYQYAGYRYDSETGLYYMPARSYSPALGRFMQSDPAGFRGGFNLYAYAGNDPVNSVDPTGLTPDAGGYTVKLSESVPTLFLGLVGIPSINVSVTAHVDSNAPAKFVILGSKTENMGSFSYYYYQLETAQGKPLTGDGYTCEEHVVGQAPVITSNDRFVPLNHGIFKDAVGFANIVNGVPQSKTLPANMNYYHVFFQTFTVEYEGQDYNLSTEFDHVDSVVNGNATNIVTDLAP